jgi:hypothetical protein
VKSNHEDSKKQGGTQKDNDLNAELAKHAEVMRGHGLQPTAAGVIMTRCG